MTKPKHVKDKNGICWIVRTVKGDLAWMLCGRASYESAVRCDEHRRAARREGNMNFDEPDRAGAATDEDILREDAGYRQPFKHICANCVSFPDGVECGECVLQGIIKKSTSTCPAFRFRYPLGIDKA